MTVVSVSELWESVVNSTW